MSCDETQTLLHPYADGELDAAHSLAVEAHLETCPACRVAQRQQQDLHTALAEAELRYAPPPDLQRRIQIALRQGTPAPAPRRWPGRTLSLVAAFACVALLAFGLRGLLVPPPSDDLLAQEVVAAHIRSLQPGHLADVISTDQHTVKPWFDGKLDFSPPVTDFAAQGFPLLGGRLDYLGDRPVAALVYGRRQHRINLFVWPASGAAAAAPSAPTTQQGYHAIHWLQGGLAYWTVSDVSEADLIAFVGLVRGAP